MNELQKFFIKRKVILPDGHTFEDAMYCEAEDEEKALERGWDLLPPVTIEMASRYIVEEDNR